MTKSPCLTVCLLWLAFIGLAPIFLSRAVDAHAIPIYPVHIRLRVLPGQVQAEIHANACYWNLEVIGVEEPPPDAWSEALAAKSQTYIDGHFTLFADGQPLPSRLIRCRYSEDPFPGWAGRHVRFDLLYDLPPGRATLAGRAVFYKEYRPELLEEAKEVPRDFPETFETDLSISGRRNYHFVLTLDKPDFSVQLQDTLRTSLQMAGDALMAGARQMTETAPIWCCIGAAVLSWPSRKRALKGAAGIAAVFFLTGLFGKGIPESWASVVEWALVVVMSSASLTGSSAVWGIGLSVSALGWGLIIHPMPGWTNPLESGGIFLKVCYLVGVLGFAGVATAALASAGLAYRRHRHDVSEVTAESIFLTESRQVCIALLLFGLYRLAQSFLNH